MQEATLEFQRITIPGFKCKMKVKEKGQRNNALKNSQILVTDMSLPFNSQNPDKALASVKIGTYNFFSQNSELMDMIVVAEHESKKKKDYKSIADESLKIDTSEEE